MSHMSCVTCHISPVPYHLSQAPSATATDTTTDPSPANSPAQLCKVGLFANTEVVVLGNQPIYSKTYL